MTSVRGVILRIFDDQGNKMSFEQNFANVF